MKYFFHCLILQLLILLPLHAASYDEAVRFIKQADTDRAIDTFETLLKEQGPSASVYYNLGLCYQKKADVGRAVLAYQRALDLSPRSTDIKTNLTKLRAEASLPATSTLPDHLPVGISWLSRGEWSLIFLISIISLTASSIVATFTTRKNIRKTSFYIILASLITSGATAWVIQQRKTEEQWAVVIATDQSLLLSPFANAEKIRPCPAGTFIRIQSQKNDYCYANSPGGTPGWISATSIQRIKIN